MTRLITGLEMHRYASELTKLHLRNRQTLPTPCIPTITETKARLFEPCQQGHQVTVTMSHSDAPLTALLPKSMQLEWN
ncbi:TPA: hypothetical protein ACGD2U_004473 [Aeromonas veronii]